VRVMFGALGKAKLDVHPRQEPVPDGQVRRFAIGAPRPVPKRNVAEPKKLFVFASRTDGLLQELPCFVEGRGGEMTMSLLLAALVFSSHPLSTLRYQRNTRGPAGSRRPRRLAKSPK